MKKILLVLLAVLSFTRPSLAQECNSCAVPPPQPPQPLPGYYYQPQPRLVVREVEMPRTGLIIGGAVITGLMVLPIAIAAGVNADPRLLIPVVGPIWQGADLYRGPSNYGISNVGATFLIIDALGQAAGLSMIIAGSVARKKVLIYDRVAILPVTSTNYAGLSVSFTF